MSQKTENIHLICPKCHDGILFVNVEIYTERQMSVEVLLHNLLKLDKPILKYDEATEDTLGIGHSLHCSYLECSFQIFFDDEDDMSNYVRHRYSENLKSEETFSEVRENFVSLIRKDQIVDSHGHH